MRLTAAEVADYQRGYGDSTLWPTYHDALDRPLFQRRWRPAYARVNGRFAVAAAAAAAPGAQVSIHGHRLQLVPGLLRKLRPDLRIGFHLHAPFPPAELFTRLPHRSEILAGLLGADVIEVQRQGAVRNLPQLCQQLLGLPVTGSEIDVCERRVRVHASGTGVDAAEVSRLAALDAVRARARDFRDQLGNPRTVLLGVDTLDASQGTENRLAAFHDLLAAGHLDIDEATLVQVVWPDEEPTAARRALRDRIEHQVGRINGDHGRVGGPVVHYLYRSHDLAERVALYLAADVLTVTALREDTSLVAKEYVAARRDGTGAVVLSEMTGAAADLPDGFLVNPHDAEALRTAILTAVHAAPAARMARMRAAVLRHDVHRWAGGFLAGLAAVTQTVREAQP